MINRIVNKIMKMITVNRIRKKYSIKKINIHGKVQLDNPNISFGENVSLYQGVQIWGDALITIGNNVAIGKDTIIFAHEPMYIGDDTLISAQCYIIDSNHGIEKSTLIREQSLKAEPIYIGKDVWIGAGSKILKGSYISDGSVVGAMSLVNGFTEPYSVNVGIPIRKISYRK